MGVAVAGLLTACTSSSAVTWTVCRQAILPFLRSIASTSSFFSVLSKLVRKMRSAEMLGEEWPCGNSIDQRRFCFGPNFTGPAVVAMPDPLDPRYWDHSIG